MDVFMNWSQTDTCQIVGNEKVTKSAKPFERGKKKILLLMVAKYIQ